MHFSLAAVVSWAALALSAAGAPASLLAERDVVAPPITNPKAGTVWTVGATEKVEWDTSDLPPPANITNKVGMVVLGYLDDNDPDGGEHLDLDHPLAKGFPITQGSVTVTVPAVDARNDYIIVLFGDSGNLSPKFTIQLAIDNPGSSSAVPTVSTHSSPSIPTSETAPGSSAVSTSASATPTLTPTSSVVVTTATRTSTTVVPPTSTAPGSSTAPASSATAPSSSGSATSLPASVSASRTSSASGAPSSSTSAGSASSKARTPVAIAVGLALAALAL